ncbi:unnamed protein product [Adineta steineri]|uniref:Dynamin N-terminal domain-containing protein n=1 Tax=Adineta steineri TaxID=433720 RepID=A0A819GMD8_9BILA|nr:unnamed protein product [Adineta steineri]CAF3882138.1 unnamed protein product [Adineta steineri]
MLPSSPPTEGSTFFNNQTTHVATYNDHNINDRETGNSLANESLHVENTSSFTGVSKADNTVLSESSSTEARIVSADVAVKEIQADKKEARHVIATYGINPDALLHMVERWTQTMLEEFKSAKYHFKHPLRQKWEKQEFKMNAETNNRKRILYQHFKALQQYTQTYLSKKSFEELKEFVSKVDQNANVNELKEKVNNLIDTFFKIIESLEFIEQYDNVGDGSSFFETKKVLERLRVLNNKQSHRICIIGLEKCGKSTYINALIGFELLPTASERCTQIRTVLKPLLQENRSLFATVEYYSDSDFEVLIAKMVKRIDEQDQQCQSRKVKIRETRQQLISKFPEREENFKLSGNYGSADDERKNYELSDVPGFDSPIKEHRDAGLEAIKVADAFLFLTDGGRPSLTRDQIHLLNEIQDGKQHYEAMKRAFGIVTKLDCCHTPHQFNERSTKARQELVDKGFKEDHIFAVCSIMNHSKEKFEEHQTIINKIRHFDDLQNGFQHSKEALNRFIEFELPKTHLNQLIDLGCNKLGRYAIEGQSNAKNLFPPGINPDDETSCHDYYKQETDEKWDEIYHRDFFQPTFDKANIWQKRMLVLQRIQFIEEVKRRFNESFDSLTKSFIECPVDMHNEMMKQYSYTALHSTSQPIDDRLREDLSFKLETFVSQTVNTLARYLYDEYVNKLERILNEISPEENDDLYRTQRLSYDICKHEIRAIVLHTCRPIITATLRFSHSDKDCRCSAVNELIRIAPAIACHLCEVNSSTSESVTTNLKTWAPVLKEGIEVVLGLYGKTCIQNTIASEIFKFALKKFL